MTDAPNDGRKTFAFLFRSEAGTVDARTWTRGASLLAVVLGVLTVPFVLLRPVASRGLNERALLDGVVLFANLAVLLYALLALLVAISWANLTAKRFRDRGREPALGLAGIAPLAILLDGALHWLQPQVADVLPRPTVFLGDAAVLAALAWTVAECADLIGRRSS